MTVSPVHRYKYTGTSTGTCTPIHVKLSPTPPTHPSTPQLTLRYVTSSQTKQKGKTYVTLLGGLPLLIE